MQTESTNYFSGLRDSLTGLVFDYGRAKLIDVETKSDDKNIPDRADLTQGALGVGGMPLGSILVIGVVGVCVVAAVVAVMRRRR